MGGTTRILTAEEFMAGIELKTEPFEVPGLGWVETKGLGLVALDEVRENHKDKPLQQLLAIVEHGLVQPQLSPTALQIMQQGNPQFIVAIANRILAQSGQKKEKQEG